MVIAAYVRDNNMAGRAYTWNTTGVNMPYTGNYMRCNGGEARLIDCEGSFRTDYYVRNGDQWHSAGVICSNGMHLYCYAYI